MLFNSVEFLVFLPLVFLAYWAIQPLTRTAAGLKTQNALLLVASYVFYGWWDWRFLSLIALSTVVDWWVGRRIHASRNARNLWLGLSLGLNLGLLGYFKYANFFMASWVDAWGRLGVNVETSTLNLILPVGISFYTFQTLSYTLDIYRGKMKPTASLLEFAAFVGFFPQLVAGPIERASALLPQIQRPRTFDLTLAQSGLRFRFTGISAGTATWLSEPGGCLASGSTPTLRRLTSHGTSPSFGGGGTSLCPPGSKTTCTSRLGDPGMAWPKP